jgi:hypothetical protein
MRFHHSKSFLMIMFIAFLSASASAHEDVPEWVNNYSSTAERMVAVGAGDGRLEALVDAMVQLAEAVETYIMSDQTYSLYLTRLSLGNVNIHSTRIRLVEDEGEEKDMAAAKVADETISEFNFSKDKKRMSVNLSHAETFTSDATVEYQKTDYQVSSENCTVVDLIKELEGIGCSFRFHGDSEHYYIMVEIDTPKLEKALKQMD